MRIVLPAVAVVAASGTLGAWMLLNSPSRAADPGSPPAPRQAVTDLYHGVQVPDPYRWLEDPKDPKVEQWVAAEDARTRGYLDALPQRGALYDRLYSQIAATSSSYSDLFAIGATVFALYTQPPKQQPMIAVLDNRLDGKHPRIIVDPNAINPKGTTAIDWFVPSPNGKRVAVSLSENGSEDGTVRIFDTVSGAEVGERIPRVQFPTGGGSLAWRADSAGFWYTRYPGPDRPADEQHFFQQLYFHRLGDDPSKDAYVAGRDFPKVAEIKLDNRFDRSSVVVSVANGDGGQFAHYLIGASGEVRKICDYEDKVVSAIAGPDHSLYLVSRKDAPRGKLLKLPPGALDLARAQVLVPESDAAMQGGVEQSGEPVVITQNAIYLRELVGGPSRVAIYGLDGKAKGTLPLPEVSSVSELEPLSDGTLLYPITSYLRPRYFSRYEETNGKSVETSLVETSPVSFDDAEVVREFARSKDGTSVPLNIIRRKGVALNAATPVLLYGYGGYDISLVPEFLGPSRRLWLDGGGIYVIANLRGGGEFGESWHLQGALTHKQNVFDDFIASAEYLIAHGYTSPQHLAILGGSNGGLLMGAAFTQRPELFRAVVSMVGIYDMLRVERDPNGLFNTTEFGSTKDPAQFKALYAYSPYHHVVDGTSYPAIFMATGATDGRVNPAHSRKMIARLQAATSSGEPVYLSINTHAGHGIGSALSIRVNQTADLYAFLFDQLGMRLPPTPSKAQP